MKESNSIEIFSDSNKVGELFFNKSTNEYGFNYTENITPISLIMPYRKASYIWKNRLHPIFDMNMPEGYLYELFRKLLSKEHGYVDDYLVLSYLAPNIQSRLSFKSWFEKKLFNAVDIDDIIHNDTEDTFTKLLDIFLNKNAISGVQPKTLALVKHKSSLITKEYIIKTWGDEFPRLAENEYFCLKAAKYAGIPIPNIILSENCRFLLVERFNYDPKTEIFLGFEEVLGLLGKNSDEKYSGSYEQIAKVIYSVCTDKEKAMKSLYKTIIMSYLLKNGDAHLKNFGVLYDNSFKNIEFAPAYDIVNTTSYMYKDRPALTMNGKKLWYGKKELISFGIKNCYLSAKEVEINYGQCIRAIKKTEIDIEEYLKKQNSFFTIGKRMIDVIHISLQEQTIKEIPDETIRNWG